MRIWLQKHAVEGRLPLLDETYRRHIAVVAPASEVHVEGLPAAAYDAALPAGIVRYGAAEAMFSWYFAAQAFVAEGAGYDAYAIGASTDPGLEEGRAVAAIPVLGMGETAFFACASRGLGFGVVGAVPELEELLRANLARYGLLARLTGFAYLEGGPALVREALEGRSEEFLRRFEEKARELVGRGARVIIPGEGLPNEALFAGGVSQVGGVPVLDTTGLLLQTAEQQVNLARLGVFRLPREGYRDRPLPQRERERLFGLFAPAVIRRREAPAGD